MTTTATHPLRIAIEAAEAELAAALAADEMMCADDSIEATDPTYLAGLARIEAAETARAAARAALAGSDCPREWVASEDGCVFWRGLAASAADAYDAADPTTDPSDYGAPESTVWTRIHIECDETGEVETYSVQIDPDEPECADGETHNWRSPHSVLGGCEENPGVSGHGGGVIIREVCAHCGTYRVTDTWAQRPDTGEQGLKSVAYEDADDDSLAWVERRAERCA